MTPHEQKARDFLNWLHGNGNIKPMDHVHDELAKLFITASLEGERRGIERAAADMDCGGPKEGKDCTGRPLLKDSTCVRECSGDCFHANANEIRALKVGE